MTQFVSKLRVMLATLIAVCCLATSGYSASYDAFLQLDGIPGESNDPSHPGQIEIESFSWGASNPGTRAGKVQLQDFHFASQLSKASPKLMLACATGEHIKKAVITMRKSGSDQPQTFLQIELENVLISSYSTAGGGGEVPSESLSLNYTKITYRVMSEGREVSSASWDLVANKKI